MHSILIIKGREIVVVVFGFGGRNANKVTRGLSTSYSKNEYTSHEDLTVMLGFKIYILFWPESRIHLQRGCPLFFFFFLRRLNEDA